MVATEKEKLKAALAKKISHGDYRGGLQLAKAALKKYPKDFDCRFQYAKLLGDWADELPAAKKKKLKRESLRIIRPLLRSLAGQPADSRFSVCLNYYYQSEDFVGMTRFGRRLAARKDRQGFYALGLGSSLHSLRLFRKKRTTLANAWAKKSVSAWRRYDLSKVSYYFPHYVSAIAHGVLGNRQQGMQALRQAARLSRRDITDWEFADALSLLRS